MYYAFIAGAASRGWKGALDLRGLEPGKYRVFDYANETDLGIVDASNRRIATEFKEYLMLRVSKE